jgi:Protein of unknown function (DUF3987)
MSAKPSLTLPSSIAEVIDLTQRLEPPRPLIRELPPADPFPVEALGEILEPAARGINDRVQAPMAICGQSVLAVGTLAVQGHADGESPTGQVKPLSCFFLSVAPTGERKTAGDTEALWPVKKRETALRESYDKSLLDYHNAKMAWDAAQKQIVSKGKGDRIAIKRALDQLGPPPAPPLTPLLTCPEPTYQGLVKCLAAGQPSIGIFAGEGGQFIGGHGMNDDNKLATAGGLSDSWDGVSIKRVRSGDGVTILPGRRVAMHLLAQPDVAAMMLADRLLLSQGLLSRILVTAPESLAGTRMWREPSAHSDRAIKRYGARILAILERPLPLADGKTNELAPRPLPLAAEARKIWIDFADNVEAQIKNDGVFAPIRGLANKLPEHAQRLGSVTALVADIEAASLSADDLARGIMLAQHYAAEALRLFEASQVSRDLMLAQKLLLWLTGTWEGTEVSLPDIYQSGPSAIRDKATASRIVGTLEDHGHLFKIEGGTEIAGHHRRDAWHIIRKLTLARL